MSLSEYKVAALLNDFRERYGYKRMMEHRVDSLEISDEAQSEASRLQRYLARSKPPLQWVTPQNILEVIADRAEYEAIVEYEQQRRAGLFVEPNYTPPNPPPLMGLVQDYSNAIADAEKSGETPPTETESISSESEKVAATQTESSAQSEKGGVALYLEDEVSDDFLMEEDESQVTGNHVIFGSGKILPAATFEFIRSHPDSALKFITQRDLDEKPLSAEIADVHETWLRRGLSRKLIRDYILNLMDLEDWPKERRLADIWSDLRDAIYDMPRY